MVAVFALEAEELKISIHPLLLISSFPVNSIYVRTFPRIPLLGVLPYLFRLLGKILELRHQTGYRLTQFEKYFYLAKGFLNLYLANRNVFN